MDFRFLLTIILSTSTSLSEKYESSLLAVTSLLLTIETSATTTIAVTRTLTKYEQTMFITITPITPSLSLSTVEPARFNEPL